MIHLTMGAVGCFLNKVHKTVSNPGFPDGGVNSKEGTTNLFLGQFFLEKSMKMKNFCRRGGGEVVVPALLLCPPLHKHTKSRRFCLVDVNFQ